MVEHQEWRPAIVGFGSNVGNRKAHIEQALHSIAENESIRILAISTLIETPPYGYLDQNEFINGAVYLETLLDPHDLLHFLQKLENESGRKRTIHWRPRTLDLDIIYYDDLILNKVYLIIPHPGLHERLFVLEPVCEIAPDYVDPRSGVY